MFREESLKFRNSPFSSPIAGLDQIGKCLRCYLTISFAQPVREKYVKGLNPHVWSIFPKAQLSTIGDWVGGSA